MVISFSPIITVIGSTLLIVVILFKDTLAITKTLLFLISYTYYIRKFSICQIQIKSLSAIFKFSTKEILLIAPMIASERLRLSSESGASGSFKDANKLE